MFKSHSQTFEHQIMFSIHAMLDGYEARRINSSILIQIMDWGVLAGTKLFHV